MKVFTKVFVRPSIDVEWPASIPGNKTDPRIAYPDGATDWLAYDYYHSEHYRANNRMVDRTLAFSEDKLTMTIAATFIDQAAYNDFVTDTFMNAWWSARDEYMALVGMTLTSTTVDA